MMHITAFLALVTALISAATPSPAALPQTAEIDIHLELNSKDVTTSGSVNQRETKQDPNYHAKQIGPSLGYPFRLKGHLQYGVPIFPEPPPPYYQFPKRSWLEQGILSREPTIFKLEQGKLVVGDKEVGLLRPFDGKAPAPAILVLKGRGLNFTIDREIGGERLLLLRIVEPRFCEPRLIFQGDSIYSFEGTVVNINFEPIISPSPTPITWEIERVDGKTLSEDEFANNGPVEGYEQDVLAKSSL